MLYLREEEVVSLVTRPMALEAVRLAHQLHAEGAAIDSPRERSRAGKVSLHILQGALPTLSVVGYKAYVASPRGVKFLLHMFDANTGEPMACIEADALGQKRTAAAAALAAQLLARPQSSRLALIGAGWQAEGHLEAMSDVFKLKSVKVYSRRAEPLEKFCKKMEASLGIEIIPSPSAEAAVEDADLITTLTFSKTPVLKGAWVNPGTHITAAGSNALSRQELDDEAIAQSSLICVDSRATALKECGDLLSSIEKGNTHSNHWAELGELVAGYRPGRKNAQDNTLFESQGLAIQDLSLGLKVVQLAREMKVGKEMS